jgi:23S rRNA A1618 N6-methylase RlmF
VFISHSFETDHQLALRLAADLRADVDVWVAPESIAPGESWLSSVERGLGASRVFLALLSKASHLPAVRAALRQAGARDVRILDMAQGQKKSRLVAWTFLAEDARERWRRERWAAP